MMPDLTKLWIALSILASATRAEEGSDNRLDFTVKIPMPLTTPEDAKASFAAVQGDPTSDVFWGRWEENELDFEMIGQSFLIMEGGIRHYISDFTFDPVNDCVSYTYLLESDEFPEGVSLTGNTLNLLHDTGDDGYVDFLGSFNCRFHGGETPGLDQAEYCSKMTDVWHNCNPEVVACVSKHYNDGQHEHCLEDHGH